MTVSEDLQSYTMEINKRELRRGQKYSWIILAFQRKRCEFVVQGYTIRLIFTHSHIRWFKCCPSTAFKIVLQPPRRPGSSSEQMFRMPLLRLSENWWITWCLFFTTILSWVGPMRATVSQPWNLISQFTSVQNFLSFPQMRSSGEPLSDLMKSCMARHGRVPAVPSEIRGRLSEHGRLRGVDKRCTCTISFFKGFFLLFLFLYRNERSFSPLGCEPIELLLEDHKRRVCSCSC